MQIGSWRATRQSRDGITWKTFQVRFNSWSNAIKRRYVATPPSHLNEPMMPFFRDFVCLYILIGQSTLEIASEYFARMFEFAFAELMCVWRNFDVVLINLAMDYHSYYSKQLMYNTLCIHLYMQQQIIIVLLFRWDSHKAGCSWEHCEQCANVATLIFYYVLCIFKNA